MDLENQKRVKEFAEEYGPENVVVIVGAAEGEAAGLAAETVTAGDPTFAGPLTGVQLGLTTYHVCEPELKEEFDPAVYDEQVGMMEMVLDVDDIVDEMSAIRDEYCKYLYDKEGFILRSGISEIEVQAAGFFLSPVLLPGISGTCWYCISELPSISEACQ